MSAYHPNDSGQGQTDEMRALRNIFDIYDTEGTGRISIPELENVLSKMGRSSAEIEGIIKAAEELQDPNSNMGGESGLVTFEQFLELLEASTVPPPMEGADPKVLEFLRILEEYRLKCEEEGNYLEAARAHRQLQILKKQEQKRQQKAVRARQIAERQDVQIAHNMQFADFNAAWDRYMEEYDKMAQMYIQQMTERHAVKLFEFQRELQSQIKQKPPKWSRELIEWRRRQHILARQRNYAEAQKIKQIGDQLEEKERKTMDNTYASVFARKEAKFRVQQQAELQALLKRIDARRKEHIKQRNLDSKRLLQRNRNVQAVLESKQAVESVKIFQNIKKGLKNASAGVGTGTAGTPSSGGGVAGGSPSNATGAGPGGSGRRKKRSKKKSLNSTGGSGRLGRTGESENHEYEDDDDDEEEEGGGGGGVGYSAGQGRHGNVDEFLDQPGPTQFSNGD